MRFIKEGDVQEALDFDGRPQNIGGRVYFEVGFLETSADAVTGTTVDVTATDAHQTETRMVALERANFYGNLVEEYDYPSLNTPAAAWGLGAVSGYAASWGSTVRGAKQGVEGAYEVYQSLRQNPVEYLQGVTEIIDILEQYGLLDILINAFFGPIHELQKTNNPYDEAENPELYTKYKVGWYEAYVAGKVAQIVVTATGSRVVANSRYTKKIDDVLGDRSTTYRSLKGLKHRKDAAEVFVVTKLVDGAGRVGSGTVRGARTVGSKVRVWQLSRQVDVDGTDLTTTEQQALRVYLQTTNHEGVRMFNRMDSETRRDLLNLGTRCSVPASGGYSAFTKGGLWALRSGVSVLRSEGWTYDELAESGYTVHDQRDWIWIHQENGAGGLEEAISAIVEAGEGAIDLSQDINGTIRSSLISVGQTDEVLGEMCIFVSIRTDSGYLRKEHAARTNMLSVIKSLIRKLTPTILFAGASLHVPSSRVQNLNNGLQYISPVTYFSPKLLATHDRELLHQTPHANICDCGDGVLLVSDENFVYVHDDASEQEIEQHLGLPFFDEYRDGDRA